MVFRPLWKSKLSIIIMYVVGVFCVVVVSDVAVAVIFCLCACFTSDSQNSSLLGT